MKKYIVWFNEVDKNDIGLVGGKGANLGEMTKAGLPVPPGFIVTADAYFHFIKSAKLKDNIERRVNNLDYNDSKALAKAAKAIRDDILEASMPKDIAEDIMHYYFSLSFRPEYARLPNKLSSWEKVKLLSSAHKVPVAVRSSATAEDLPEASFAGQQATFLNVKGEANLVKAVQKAWASLFTARAMFYRNDHGFGHFKVGIAVPVQKMVASEVSGVMFTIDPVTNDKQHMVIEAIYGLGELIVQGAVTPDQYVVEKSSRKIKNKKIGKQLRYMPAHLRTERDLPLKMQNVQKLSDEHIQELALFGKRLEKHYYFPQDIEWALEKNKLYIVQTRPITTIGEQLEKENADITKKLSKLKKIAAGTAASPGIASGPAEIIKSEREIHKIDEGDVLVAEQTNPDFVPAMKKASAIVTQKGGRTSHAAIVSRELGLPAVVGANEILSNVSTNELITVDGAGGVVYKGALDINAVKTFNKGRVRHQKEYQTATKIYTNLASVDRAEEVSKLHVDGVGLLRAEFMLADIGVHPQYVIENKKTKGYIASFAERLAVFCNAFGPDRPVVYRTSDFKTNEYKNLKHGSKYEKDEENPMIGYRGAGRYTDNPEVFELELKAVKMVRNKMNHKNLHVMIPFVRTPEELTKTKRIMAGAGLMRSGAFKLWMMAEIPANVIRLEDFIAAGIDGISIGSNDLTQLTLGVDRDNEKLSKTFNEMDTAVLLSLEKLIKTCGRHRVTCSICGQAPSDYPELVKKLVRWGITSISVNPDVIYDVREQVWREEQKLIKI